ncbi:MAG: type I-E CRISPR-associated protein Cse2/CasB [Desulfonatronovibrio sp.]
MGKDFFYKFLRGETEKKAVHEWWVRLAGDPSLQNKDLKPWPNSHRAILRRAHTPEDALLSDGFRNLWFALPAEQRKPWDMQAWGCVSVVLADVKSDDPELEFAACLAREHKSHGEGTGKPCVSELRFAQLQRSNDLNELQRRMRRLISLVDGKINILSLADGILQWHREKMGYFEPRPERRLSVRWANAYFTELAKYQR